MNDQDFDFHRPTERREAKRFEPPPWEREAFEELERRRREDEARQAAEASRPEPAAEAEPVAPEAPREDPVAAQAERQPAAGDSPADEGHKAQLDEKLVIELMAGLAAEEPSIQPAVQRVSLVTAIFIAGLGTVMILWGMAALVGSARTGPMGAFGGAILLFFGAVAIAGAVWLTVRTLRQRGVL